MEHKKSEPGAPTSDTMRPCRLNKNGNRVPELTIDSGKINILDSAETEEIVDAVEYLSQDESIRCLILHGNDRAFIDGTDLNEMATLGQQSARPFITGLYRLYASVHIAPFPVIGRLHGWCLGVSAELAAACDIRISSYASIYTMPDVKIGIPSAIRASLLSS